MHDLNYTNVPADRIRRIMDQLLAMQPIVTSDGSANNDGSWDVTVRFRDDAPESIRDEIDEIVMGKEED